MNTTITPCPIGVVGDGHFGGEVIVRYFLDRFPLKVYDRDPRKQKMLQAKGLFGTLEEVAQQPTLIVAVPPVPRRNFEDLLGRIAQTKKDGLVIDVCSNKTLPLESMQQILPPPIELIGSHPLFGQVTAADGLEGLTIAICKTRVSEPTWEKVLGVLQSFWLKVKHTDPETHDREMARVQGLTHFIGRVMEKCGLRRSPHATRPYRQLYGVKEIVCADSWPLFLTTQLGNPFAAFERQRFIENLEKILDLLSVARRDHGDITSPRDTSPTQGLSFLIGWVLSESEIEDSQFSTRTFEHLQNVKKILSGASWKRFLLTQLNGAIFELEETFLRQAVKLDQHLKKLEKAERCIRAA